MEGLIFSERLGRNVGSFSFALMGYHGSEKKGEKFMLVKCASCSTNAYLCSNYENNKELKCREFKPDVNKVKEYASSNDISILETIELIKLCHR